jgi:hypothetical protein
LTLLKFTRKTDASQSSPVKWFVANPMRRARPMRAVKSYVQRPAAEWRMTYRASNCAGPGIAFGIQMAVSSVPASHVAQRQWIKAAMRSALAVVLPEEKKPA